MAEIESAHVHAVVERRTVVLLLIFGVLWRRA
jgi:hypothetical protein